MTTTDYFHIVYRYCRSDRIYRGYKVEYNFRRRFYVTEVNNGSYITRDLNINSTLLTDAGVYLCAEIEDFDDIIAASSAQLIVLGDNLECYIF